MLFCTQASHKGLLGSTTHNLGTTTGHRDNSYFAPFSTHNELYSFEILLYDNSWGHCYQGLR